MSNTTFKLLLLSATCALSLLNSGDVSAQQKAEDLITDGSFFGEVRYRYENVDQENFSNNATANTIRTNVGFKTGVYKDFQALIEGQIVQNIGDENFNDTVNGNTSYPVVADPDVSEINELWLSWSGLPETVIKVGRQKINMDNQRFIGTVGWRQNDQTFDALQINNKSIENLDLTYGYVRNVNRIFGDDHPSGDLSSEIHIVNASYEIADWCTITGYGYWIELDRLAARSSQTYGLRATGKTAVNDDWKFIYEAEYAHQDDYANNTTNYDENYYHVSPGITGHGLTLKGGYEVLSGDGSNAFQTPLATLHKFNGWADAFLSTPDAGLEDTYISLSYKVDGTDTLADGFKLTSVYHDFDSNDSSSGDFGDETDLSISKTFKLPDGGQPFKTVNVLIKYADYEGDNGIADREKFWLQISTKF